MNKMDNVIKNKARLMPVQSPAKYEPEYVRLNKTPEIFDMVDDEVFDDKGNIKLDLDMSGHIIDNNDIVDFGFVKQEPRPTQNNKIPEMNEYILMIFGKVILSGSLEVIEARVKSAIYGETGEFGASVKVDDIVVLKRIPIKVGVFVGE